MSLPTAAVVYGNYNTDKTEENAKYIKAIIQRYVNKNFDFTTGAAGLNAGHVDKAETGYRSCIANFTNETDSTRTASITLEDDYICPYTAYQTTTSNTLNTLPTLHEINNACANLQRLSSTFKQDIIDFKYGDINYVVPSSLITLPPKNSSRVPLTADIAKNAYSSMIYYIEYAIFMLSHLMKSPFAGIGTKTGDSITLTSYSSTFNMYIGTNQSNYVELGATYNTGGTTTGTFTYLGFSHPGSSNQRQKVIDQSDYKNYKRYVLFVRDTLKLLQSNPNFTRRNNSESPLPDNATNKIGTNNPAYRVSDVVANGINALTAAIDTFETQYDSRFNEGGKYVDSQNGLYANRSIIETKLKELYQFQGTVVDNEKQYFTVSMAAGAATTVVACGLLYYIFTEL